MNNKDFFAVVTWKPDYEEFAVRLVKMTSGLELEAFVERFQDRFNVLCTFTSADLRTRRIVGYEDFKVITREDFEKEVS